MNRTLQNAATTVYDKCRRQGWLEHPGFQRVFQSAYFIYKRRWEDVFAPLVTRVPELFRQGHILDIGANIGYTASVFAPALSPGYRVFAFEPEARNAAWLRKNIQRRGLQDRVDIFETAVGERSGSLSLWFNPSHPADHRVLTDTFKERLSDGQRVQTVPVISVDEFVSKLPDPRVAFIKIDVQGYESAVCEGLRGTIERQPHIAIALEYFPDGFRDLGFSSRSLLAFFQQRGYRAEVLTRHAPPAAVNFDAIDERLGPGGYADLLFRKVVS